MQKSDKNLQFKNYYYPDPNTLTTLKLRRQTPCLCRHVAHVRVADAKYHSYSPFTMDGEKQSHGYNFFTPPFRPSAIRPQKPTTCAGRDDLRVDVTACAEKRVEANKCLNKRPKNLLIRTPYVHSSDAALLCHEHGWWADGCTRFSIFMRMM